MYHVPLDAVMKEVKMGMGRRGVRFQEGGREWRLPGLLYADDLSSSGESEQDLRAMVERFVEVRRRRGLKVKAVKSKVMVLVGEERLEYEVCVNWIRLKRFSEFKYLGCVFDESGTDKEGGEWEEFCRCY